MMPAALTMWAASRVPVIGVISVTDSHVQVNENHVKSYIRSTGM